MPQENTQHFFVSKLLNDAVCNNLVAPFPIIISCHADGGKKKIFVIKKCSAMVAIFDREVTVTPNTIGR